MARNGGHAIIRQASTGKVRAAIAAVLLLWPSTNVAADKAEGGAHRDVAQEVIQESHNDLACCLGFPGNEDRGDATQQAHYDRGKKTCSQTLPSVECARTGDVTAQRVEDVAEEQVETEREPRFPALSTDVPGHREHYCVHHDDCQAKHDPCEQRGASKRYHLIDPLAVR